MQQEYIDELESVLERCEGILQYNDEIDALQAQSKDISEFCDRKRMLWLRGIL